MLLAFFSIIDMLLQLAIWVIIAQIILSWLVAFNVINRSSGFVSTLVQVLERITDPLYRPIRKILPDFGGIDFSPLILILAIQVLRMLLSGVALEVGPTIT